MSEKIQIVFGMACDVPLCGNQSETDAAETQTWLAIVSARLLESQARSHDLILANDNLKEPIRWNYALGFGMIIAAVFVIFKRS